MTERTDAYQAACIRRDAAYEAVLDKCVHVVLLAKQLQISPQRVHIVGIPHTLGNAKTNIDFDGSQWPTALDINNALMEYHEAVGTVQVAWLNLQSGGQTQGFAAPLGDPWAAMRTELQSRVNRQIL